jgi:hypothetical protein
LISGAVYTSETSDNVLDVSRGQGPCLRALGRCIEEHPILSAVIIGGDSEKPNFALLETLDLSKHIVLRDLDVGSSEDERIQELLAEVSDEQFLSVDQVPPWKVVLISLPARDNSSSRLLALFAYYHSHGDGRAGLAFHRTFLEGLTGTIVSREAVDGPVSHLFNISSKELPPPMEVAGKLSLSWSYLLSPLLGACLPTFLATMLGFRASAIAQGDDIWCGKDLSFDPNNFRTGLVMITIDHNTINNALQRCRARQTSFTGFINQLIAHSLHATLGQDHSNKSYASQVVIDLRRLFQGTYTDNSMTNCVSAYSETIPPPAPADHLNWTNPAHKIWAAARNTTTKLAKSAATLHNQPIGLLQYLKNFRPWTLGQIGKKREGSYEISNLVVFDPVAHVGSLPSPIRIEKTIFAQPANAAGACLNFNLVTTKGGPLVMTVTWQKGVLDVKDTAQEVEFVREVCTNIGRDISELAAAPL